MMSTTQMADAAPEARPLRDERDWWRVRALLVATHATVHPGWNWDIRRWDGWQFHAKEPVSQERLARVVGLWETPDGRLRGAVHPESPGEAYLELDPAFYHLEPAMVAWAEESLAAASGNARERSLTLHVNDVDERRRRPARGARLRDGGRRRVRDNGCAAMTGRPRFRRSLRARIACAAPKGQRAIASAWQHSSTPPSTAPSTRQASTARSWIARPRSSTSSTSSRSPLMARSPRTRASPTILITATASSSRCAPHPDHRRRGLARTLVLEGVRRVAARGARTASLDTGEGQAANALYAGCGFTEAYRVHPWRREL